VLLRSRGDVIVGAMPGGEEKPASTGSRGSRLRRAGVCWRTVVRRMRGDGRAWKEIAAELGVAPSTAIWLAGRYRTKGQPSARRAILATLGCAGLRNSEVCALNLADLDFAHGVIHVRDSKTEAGIRQVNMTPWLRDELFAYRVTRPNAESTVAVRARRSGPAGVDRSSVPHADGCAPGQGQREPSSNCTRRPSRRCATSRAREPTAAGAGNRTHVQADVHHPYARGRSPRPIRPSAAWPRGRHDDFEDLRAGPETARRKRPTAKLSMR
jgi:integrase